MTMPQRTGSNYRNYGDQPNPRWSVETASDEELRRLAHYHAIEPAFRVRVKAELTKRASAHKAKGA